MIGWLDVGCWMLDVGCSMLDVGCSMLDGWMVDVGWLDGWMVGWLRGHSRFWFLRSLDRVSLCLLECVARKFFLPESGFSLRQEIVSHSTGPPSYCFTQF